VTRIVNAALDGGVNLIDTLEEYSVTSAVGEGHSEGSIGVDWAVGATRQSLPPNFSTPARTTRRSEERVGS
jgi:hypothetical protein